MTIIAIATWYNICSAWFLVIMNIKLLYIYIVALPVIVRQPVSTVTEVHKVAIFECIARSYGSVSITWKRWNSKLPVTANIMTIRSLNEVNSTLRIEKSIGYYKGYYYCVIENIIGSIDSEFAYCNITGM